jgi:hypothetical protein
VSHVPCLIRFVPSTARHSANGVDDLLNGVFGVCHGFENILNRPLGWNWLLLRVDCDEMGLWR